ncbi:interleukin-15 receptor subunit alpha isoform X1 [Lepisosteus oculatus]|uniref:interleukin-15 receptor subunit alpha isoform X1 n=1 Tax=Lepisosteus oculatus TaxID=7918 RepID=UPI003715B1BA
MTRNAISLTLFVLFPLANYKHHDTVWAEETGYCSPPAPLSDTEHPNLARRFNEGAVFRYNCTVGYVRKAGTSNLIRCVKKNNTLVWSQSNLICITDPKLKRTKTSALPVLSKASLTPTAVQPETASTYRTTPASTTKEIVHSETTSPYMPSQTDPLLTEFTVSSTELESQTTEKALESETTEGAEFKIKGPSTFSVLTSTSLPAHSPSVLPSSPSLPSPEVKKDSVQGAEITTPPVEISVSSVTGAVAGVGTTFTVIILASAVMFYVWRIYRHPRSRTTIMPSELQPISKPLNNKDVTLNVPENEDEE